MRKEKECFICDKIITGETTFKASDVDKYDICEGCYNKIDKKCSTCGDALIGDEYKMPSTGKDGEVLCDDCYEDKYLHVCEICDEVRENNEKYYFVINQEIIDDKGIEYNDKPMLPGIYKPLKEHFDINDQVFGFQGFVDGALECVVNIDIPGEHWELCPQICESCVAKYKEKSNERNKAKNCAV